MITNNILTIGIPTYNGEKYLKECMDSIINQKINNYEIVISDNASIDNTNKICLEYCKKYNYISYYRNPKNIGYDQNVNNLFKFAKGKYVLLLGDDDVLLKGSIQKIINTIKSKDSDVIFHETMFYNEENGDYKSSIDLKSFLNCSNLLEEILYNSPAMSTLIFKTNTWNKLKIDKYFGSHWIHLGAIVEIIKNHGEGYSIRENLTAIRINTIRNNWNDNRLGISLDHMNLLSSIKSETFNKFIKISHKTLLNTIIAFKSHSFYQNLKSGLILIKFYYNYPLFWLIELPVLLFVPKRIIEYFQNIKQIYFTHKL